jgi:hypothetical protein
MTARSRERHTAGMPLDWAGFSPTIFYAHNAKRSIRNNRT